MTDSKERISPASSEVIAAEVESIRGLVPPKGIPIEERTVRNTQIRTLLDQLSNEALWELRGHQLSRQELIGRLQRFEPFAIESLAQIIGHYQDFPAGVSKGHRKMYGLVLQNMVKVLPEAEPDEAVEALGNLFPRWGRPNGSVIEYLLRVRPDCLTISNKLAARMNDPVLDGIRQGLTEEIDPAVVKRVSFFLDNLDKKNTLEVD